jgi:hypothetical protein
MSHPVQEIAMKEYLSFVVQGQRLNDAYGRKPEFVSRILQHIRRTPAQAPRMIGKPEPNMGVE